MGRRGWTDETSQIQLVDLEGVIYREEYREGDLSGVERFDVGVTACDVPVVDPNRSVRAGYVSASPPTETHR